MNENTKRIAMLNDGLRTSFNPSLGHIMLTNGIVSLPMEDQISIFELVKSFNGFSEGEKGNDPYGERDFGAVEHSGKKIFFKIDYYAPDLKHGSEDPSDPDKTRRVMTIMLSNEY